MDKKGFTLFEILITLFILGVVLSLLYLTFHQSMMVMATMEERAGTTEKGRLILERIGRELRNTFISATAHPASPWRLGLVAQSSKERDFSRDRLDFTTLALPGGNFFENTGHIQEIGYFLEREAGGEGLTLFRRQDDALDGDLLRGGIIQPLSSKIQELNFVFFDLQGRKYKDWNSLEGAHKGILPARIEIRLVMEDAHGKGQVFRTQVFLPLAGEK